MRLLDANVLIYAANESTPQHSVARKFLESSLSSAETVALPWTVLMAFVRITTNSRVMADPLPPDDALDYVASWLAQPNVTVPAPTVRHVEIVRDLLRPTGVGGNLVSDAHLAALAIEHGATLCSFDGDFARFGGLAWSHLGSPNPSRSNRKPK